MGRVRPQWARDLRYAATPPGEPGTEEASTTARRAGALPVRFTPPQASPARIGFLLDGHPRGRHVTATLVHMAVRGVIDFQPSPLMARRRNMSLTDDPLETKIAGGLPNPEDSGLLSDNDQAWLWRRVREDFDQMVDSGEVFSRKRRFSPVQIGVWMWAVFGAGVLAAWLASTLGLQGAELLAMAGLVSALTAGGILVGVWSGPRPLTARGTMLREQAQGFRHYLRTAEQHQLDAKVDSDIFERYLPWALVFGDVEPWAATCQALEGAGNGPSFIVPSAEPPEQITLFELLTTDLAELERRMANARRG